MLPRLLQILGAASQAGGRQAWRVPPLLCAWLRHFPAMRQFLCNKALASHLEPAFSQPCQPPAGCMVRALRCAVEACAFSQPCQPPAGCMVRALRCGSLCQHACHDGGSAAMDCPPTHLQSHLASGQHLRLV